MQGIARYTTLFAPVIFFLGGVGMIILLSKFIGKGKSPDENNSK